MREPTDLTQHITIIFLFPRGVMMDRSTSSKSWITWSFVRSMDTEKKICFGKRKTWIWKRLPSLPSFVAVDKLLNLSELQFFHFKNGNRFLQRYKDVYNTRCQEAWHHARHIAGAWQKPFFTYQSFFLKAEDSSTQSPPLINLSLIFPISRYPNHSEPDLIILRLFHSDLLFFIHWTNM